MIIVLTGGSGLIGQSLIPKLIEQNHTIHLLTRSPSAKKNNNSCETFLWNALEKPPKGAFPTSEEKWGVIHLAGESISHWPWTPSRKKKIYESRILGTKNLIDGLKNAKSSPEFFISASALGIYGTQNGEIKTESSTLSPSSSLFLEKVCKDWEREILNSPSQRIICLRFGMVLSSLGGGLLPYLRAAQMRFGFWSLKALWINWIHIQDVVKIILWTIQNQQAEGAYNVTSPSPQTLNDFSKNLLQVLGKKWSIPFPVFLLKLFGGEMARNLLANVKIFPERLNKENCVFNHPDLKKALQDLLK